MVIRGMLQVLIRSPLCTVLDCLIALASHDMLLCGANKWHTRPGKRTPRSGTPVAVQSPAPGETRQSIPKGVSLTNTHTHTHTHTQWDFLVAMGAVAREGIEWHSRADYLWQRSLELMSD